MSEFENIIRSPIFRFLVGEDEICLSVHAEIVQRISEPLNAMINNGKMQESRSGIAKLEDIEVRTFIGFCEYAYRGKYVTPSSKAIEPDTDIHEIELTPEEWEKYQLARNSLYSEPEMGAYKEAASKRGISIGKISRYSRDPAASPCDRKPRLWEKFEALNFVGQAAESSLSPDLQFHAKLYVFATRFLINDLRRQCLKSLHRDLKDFVINRESVSSIMSLLEYTYENTGPVEPKAESTLRDLVIHYIAAKARTIATFRATELQSLLADHGQMGSDLAMKLICDWQSRF